MMRYVGSRTLLRVVSPQRGFRLYGYDITLMDMMAILGECRYSLMEL